MTEIEAAPAVNALLDAGRGVRPRRDRARPTARAATWRPTEVVGRLADAAGVRPAAPDRLDYAFDLGSAVRGIVLDTAARSGGSRGVVSAAQLAWLRAQLARAGDRWVVVFAHNPLESSDGGEAALAALDAAPRVVAVVAGNRHRNTIGRATATG